MDKKQKIYENVSSLSENGAVNVLNYFNKDIVECMFYFPLSSDHITCQTNNVFNMTTHCLSSVSSKHYLIFLTRHTIYINGFSGVKQI